MPLGKEVGLGPCDIVLGGDSALPLKRAQQPLLFGPCLLWPNDCPSQLLLSSCYVLLLCYDYGRAWKWFVTYHGL